MWSAIIAAATWLLKLIFGGKPVLVREAEAADASKQAASTAEAQAKTEAAIAQAEANAPSTVAAVVSRLDRGTF